MVLSLATLSTTAVITNPGTSDSHGEEVMYCRPSATNSPHSGCGGTAPNPRKLSVEIARIAPPNSSGTNASTDL